MKAYGGGRGKGGGVKVVKSIDDVRAEAVRMRHGPRDPPQTPERGKAVNRVYRGRRGHRQGNFLVDRENLPSSGRRSTEGAA